MNLALKYKAQVFYKPIESNGESNDDFEVTLRIPKVEMILKRKTSHEINMIFNQILIFSAGLKSMLTSPSPLEWQEMKKALDKIEDWRQANFSDSFRNGLRCSWCRWCNSSKCSTDF